MHILIISKYASSSEVGFETRLFALSRVFVEKGYSVSIISSDSNHFGNYPKFPRLFNYNEISGIKVIWIKTIKYYKSVSFRRIISWIDFEIKLFLFSIKKIDRPDVIVVSSLSLLTILNGIRLKKKFGCKLIFEIRDIWPLTLIEEGGYKRDNIFVKLLAIIERYGYKKSDLIIGTMPNLKEHVRNVMGHYLTCDCIPFGFNARSYLGLKSDYSTSKGTNDIPQNRLIIGYAGSIGITNGLDSFIECIINMKNNNSFFFIILGDGALREKYIAQTKECTNVIFLPKVPREEVSGILDLCDLLYFSSLKSKVWDFGWSPNKLIDYMIAGKPVVASYSGYQSMLNEAKSGFFVPAEDPLALENELIRIKKMPKENLEKMGLAGRNWLMQNRTWMHLANNYLKLMTDLLK